MAKEFPFHSWAKIIESVKTPLSLLALVVLVIAAVFTSTISKVSGIQQVIIIFGSFILLFVIVIAVTVRTLGKRSQFPEEITSIWSKEDLPITEDEKTCWLGKWNCRWTYRTKQGDLKPYVDDIVNIGSINTETGRLTGTAVSAYGKGETYNVTGRISKKRIAHVFYSTPPPRFGLSGMAILRRSLTGYLSGWWLGAGRKGGDIGGGVTCTRSQQGDNFEVKVYPVE